MSKNRYFNTDFWSDSWVVDDLEALEAFLFIYLFTNAHVTIAGVYQISLKVMAFESKLDAADLPAMLERLKPKVFYENGWVVLANSIKNQNYHNSKIKIGIVAALEHVPDTILQHINWPSDWGEKPKPKPEQKRLIDDSYMSLDESSHSNTNIIKFNSNPNAAVPSASASPPGSKKLDKAQYAKAVRADEKLERKAKVAHTRKPEPVSDLAAASTVKLVRERLRTKGLKV